jgi:cell division septum initiation protein DivIVA
MIAIDVLYLVDRLEALLNKGWRVPMTAKTMIDEDEFLDIVDQMRIAFPEEIKQAKKIVQDRDRLIAQAQEEAQRIVEFAKEDAARLTNDHAIVKSAQQTAVQINQQANAAAAATRQGADDYAAQILRELQTRLDTLIQQVTLLQNQVINGISVIESPDTAVPADDAEQNS